MLVTLNGRAFSRSAAAAAAVLAAGAASSQSLEGVIILDFEGSDASQVLSPLPINGLTSADLAATGGSGVPAIQTSAGEQTGVGVPLAVNPDGPSLFVSLGADAGAETNVTLSIVDIVGDGFIGNGSANGDDTFDGVAATSVAADFFEFAPGTSVTFAYAGLTPGALFTIASFSSNTLPGIGDSNSGAATVGDTTIDFFPAATGPAGTGTLFAFGDIAADANGSIEITFEATGTEPTFVSGFFISGLFEPIPSPGSLALAGPLVFAAARRRRELAVAAAPATPSNHNQDSRHS